MSENEKKVPKRRFKEFENAEEWEQFKLEDLCSIVTKQTGFDYSATIKPSLQAEVSDTTYPFIQNKDFSGMNINLDTDFFIPKDIAEKFPKILLDKPAILISISGKIGNVGFYRLDNKAFIGGAVGICKLLDASDGVLIVYELSSDIGQLHFSSLTKASSHANITVEDIRKLPIKIPKSVKEKELIGMFFSSLDNLITLHQRKLEKMKVLKKAYLTDMFPVEGEHKPKLRFAGFTDDWEQYKLGDLGEVVMNRRIFKEQTSDEGDVPFYKIGTFGSEPDAFISRKLFEEYKLKYPYPEKGDILISASGSIGRTVEYMGKDEYFQDSNIVWLKHDNRIINSFLKQFYSIVKWSGLEGSTIKRLYNKNILDTPILLPKPEEQKKIGQFFIELDNLITPHQRKLEKLQNIKKAYLNEMFI
ncbi:restriction endonuclease subunit S [Clostridium chromiireducens]|uniref:Restriction endonuclease subunit S n=1 Tax=Clostridium chromiireducens TaxID=225345 RepID=A0A964W596_9CLOT|nr:restriction endonuclease subunit S [Clostridium chromiireducens]MVX67224.1 restriction endonuclease subunit S [Clostridium chromiireducens]